MASGSSKLQPRERVAFRKAYQQAWTDLCSSELQIPSNLPLFVLTSTSYTVVTGNSDAPFRVFVTADPLLPETKAVLAAGEVVLELSDEELVEPVIRSEEHTSELQSLLRISYAVFCLKNTKKHN